jgi:phosphoenolpyruvate phosphomutase
MIIARIESLICGYSIDDALERAFAYVAAGADGIMIHSKEKSGEDIRSFCEKFREKNKNTPLVVVPTTYNQIYENDLQSWGINIVIYANHMLRSAYPAMLKTAKSILLHSRAKETEENCMPIKEILSLIPITK